ncbi:MAG: sterol desaturase family protein [Spongiibacteraceae bacterium]
MTNNNEKMTSRPRIPVTAAETIHDFFFHSSPIILASVTLIFLLARVYMGNWQWLDLLAPVIIFAVWPFFEWVLHVFLLHFKPRQVFGRTIDIGLARKHRAHHADPTDLSDMMISFAVFPFAVPLISGLFLYFMPTTELALSALTMFFALALNYEWSHYLGHVNWCPPIEYYRRRVRLHRLHHYRSEQMWWGVSMGMGDVVLGTAPDVKSVERSSTVNNVHGLNPST